MDGADDLPAPGGWAGGQTELSGFAERLLAVVNEGRRVSTYKLAVLLALMDCCAEGVAASGAAPDRLSTRDVARRVASLYWPHLRPFPEHGRLRQITGPSSTILRALGSAFEALPAVATWNEAERVLPAGHVAQVLDVVELSVARDPLVRLQTVDGVSRPFLYDLDWGGTVTMARLRAGAVVHLHPGAGDQLIRLAPLLRPLVELHWIRMVADLNRLAVVDDDLRAHLFGTDRVTFPAPLRSTLVAMQAGDCFYCDRPLSGTPAIDHFIPWSRWPNDAVENLVVAHAGCNSRKSDRIPGLPPLERWAHRLDTRRDDLRAAATRARWRTDRPKTLSLARSVYAHLPAGAPVWDGPQRIGSADAAALLEVLALL